MTSESTMTKQLDKNCGEGPGLKMRPFERVKDALILEYFNDYHLTGYFKDRAHVYLWLII